MELEDGPSGSRHVDRSAQERHDHAGHCSPHSPMSTTDTPTYPNGPGVTRLICIDGTTKAALLFQLQHTGVRLNEAAQALFGDDRFTTSAIRSNVEIAELSVDGLGLRNGATIAQIVEQAEALGLSPCPLELGPHLRLQYTDQPEGHLGQAPSQHCAAPGSVTVASAPLGDDEATPKGFCLRRIEGALRLRGYRSWAGHVWSRHNVFVFSCLHNAAAQRGAAEHASLSLTRGVNE